LGTLETSERVKEGGHTGGSDNHEGFYPHAYQTPVYGNFDMEEGGVKKWDGRENNDPDTPRVQTPGKMAGMKLPCLEKVETADMVLEKKGGGEGARRTTGRKEIRDPLGSWGETTAEEHYINVKRSAGSIA